MSNINRCFNIVRTPQLDLPGDLAMLGTSAVNSLEVCLELRCAPTPLSCAFRVCYPLTPSVCYPLTQCSGGGYVQMLAPGAHLLTVDMVSGA